MDSNDRRHLRYVRKRRREIKLRCICGVVLLSVVISCAGLQRNIVKDGDNDETVNKHEGTVYYEINRDDSASEEKSSDLTDWNLILANPWNEIPDNYSVTLTELSNGHAVDERIYPDLQAMMDAARATGLSPIICSSYRTNEKQEALYYKQVEKYLSQGYSQEEAEAEAGKGVAVPGTSEHQTGLAVDIVALSYQILDENQENTAEQKWLMENSYKYGFILRYPDGKSDITGITYEPWHYRYVGKEAAKEIYEEGLCLEEYLEK